MLRSNHTGPRLPGRLSRQPRSVLSLIHNLDPALSLEPCTPATHRLVDHAPEHWTRIELLLVWVHRQVAKVVVHVVVLDAVAEVPLFEQICIADALPDNMQLGVERFPRAVCC